MVTEISEPHSTHVHGPSYPVSSDECKLGPGAQNPFDQPEAVWLEIHAAYVD